MNTHRNAPPPERDPSLGGGAADGALLARLRSQAQSEVQALEADDFLPRLLQRLALEAAPQPTGRSPELPDGLSASVWTVLPVLLLLGLGVWCAAQLMGVPSLNMPAEQWVDGLAGSALAGWTAWMAWVAAHWLGTDEAERETPQFSHAAL